MATTITANGINFPDGSAGSPSIGGSDTNTGLFTGSDIVGFATGGSERLRIDANGNVNIANDSGKLRFGTSADLSIFHDGSNSHIQEEGTGSLLIKSDAINLGSVSGEYYVRAFENGGVQIRYDNSTKIETTSGGVEVFGQLQMDDANSHIKIPDNARIDIGTGNDLRIFHNGTTGNNNISNVSGNLYINATETEVGILVKANNAVELYHDNVKHFETTSIGCKIFDNDTTAALQFANSDGDNGYVMGESTNIIGFKDNQAHWLVKAFKDGAVELYHDNVKKMETTSVGVSSLDTLITHGVIRPASDNDHSIGLSNRRYTTYFGVNGSINTSDRNEKNTIVESDLGLDFINKLKPKSYKWNKDDGKTHYGLIAQDLEETLTSLGKTIADFGGIYKEPDSPMGLGYSELIAPLIKAMQELTAKVEALEAA